MHERLQLAGMITAREHRAVLVAWPRAFPRTVYLESCYGTQCSPRSLFSHSIILAAYPLAKNSGW